MKILIVPLPTYTFPFILNPKILKAFLKTFPPKWSLQVYLGPAKDKKCGKKSKKRGEDWEIEK